MLKRAYELCVSRWEWCLAAILLVAGFGLRLLQLGALPFGLNQDEASAGYDAFALLQSGIDRCGDPWPVLLTSWGSGQNALMSYLAIPFIALLGLTETAVRLPNAISGCLTLLVFWRMARRARGPFFGLSALLLLAVNPWHVMMSRWALESNLLPFFLLLGLWCTSLARERPRTLLGAAAAFGLSLYAYGTAFFFLPPFLVCAVIWLRRTVRQNRGAFLASLVLFLLLAAPITACQVINHLGLEEVRVLGLTLPRLTEGRQAATSLLGGGSAGENYRDFLRILWTQSDGLPWNALPITRGGIFYIFGLPFALVGFVASVLRRKDFPEETPLRLALIVACGCTFCIQGNINRLNMLWLPMIYFSALGLHLVLRRLGSWAVLPAAAVAVCALLFASGYQNAFGGQGNASYFPGLGGAIRCAEGLDRGDVYVTERVNQPYIFALFYSQMPPETFAASAVYRNPDAAFRAVDRFTGWEFRDPARCGVLVLHCGEAAGRQVLASSGDFIVCEP